MVGQAAVQGDWKGGSIAACNMPALAAEALITLIHHHHDTVTGGGKC
jgi:hypothetical protein